MSKAQHSHIIGVMDNFSRFWGSENWPVFIDFYPWMPQNSMNCSKFHETTQKPYMDNGQKFLQSHLECWRTLIVTPCLIWEISWQIRVKFGQISSIIVALWAQNSMKPILNHTVTKVISFYNNSGPFEMSKGQLKLHLGVIWTIYGQVWV